jgi:hypothetical protein
MGSRAVLYNVYDLPIEVNYYKFFTGHKSIMHFKKCIVKFMCCPPANVRLDYYLHLFFLSLDSIVDKFRVPVRPIHLE